MSAAYASRQPRVVSKATVHGFTKVLGSMVPCSVAIVLVHGRGAVLTFRCEPIGACYMRWIMFDKQE